MGDEITRLTSHDTERRDGAPVDTTHRRRSLDVSAAKRKGALHATRVGSAVIAVIAALTALTLASRDGNAQAVPPPWTQGTSGSATTDTAAPTVVQAATPTADAPVAFTSTAGAVSVYVRSVDARWMLGCETPCVLRAPVGTFAFATNAAGRGAVSVELGPEGRSFQIPAPITVISDPNMDLLRRQRRISRSTGERVSLASVVAPTSAYGSAAMAGPSASQVLLYTGVTVTALGMIVSLSALGVAITSRFPSPNVFVVGVSGIVGFFVGGVLITVGAATGGPTRSALALAPVITPQVQGVTVVGRF